MLHFFNSIRTDFTDSHITVYAGNAAFFLILSVFPLGLVILGLTLWLPVDTLEILELLSSILPESAQRIFHEMFGRYDPTTVISVSAVTALWAASRGTYGLLKGLNRAYKLEETRNYWILRIHCFFETFLLVLAVASALILYVYGQPIAQYLGTTQLRFLFGSGFRFLVTTGMLILLFAMLYVLLPNHHVRFHTVLPGASFSGAGWMSFSTLYSLYVDYISGVDRLYGSLSTIAVTMLWLYICMGIFFLGGILNHNLAPET